MKSEIKMYEEYFEDFSDQINEIMRPNGRLYMVQANRIYVEQRFSGYKNYSNSEALDRALDDETDTIAELNDLQNRVGVIKCRIKYLQNRLKVLKRRLKKVKDKADWIELAASLNNM